MKKILFPLLVILFVFGSFSPAAAADPLAIVQSVSVNPENKIVISGLLPCSKYSAIASVSTIPVERTIYVTVYAHDNRPSMSCAAITAPFTIYVVPPYPKGTYVLFVNGKRYIP